MGEQHSICLLFVKKAKNKYKLFNVSQDGEFVKAVKYFMIILDAETNFLCVTKVKKKQR